MINSKKSVNRPRQGRVGQSRVSFSGPGQSDPLFRDGGLMQAWVLICVPWPQVTEQSDHTDHGVQPPSTRTNTEISNKRQDQLVQTNAFMTQKHKFIFSILSLYDNQRFTSAVNVLAVMSLRGACTKSKNKSPV